MKKIITIIISVCSLLVCANFSYAVNKSPPVIDHFASKCFTPLIVKVDTDNNVFLLYHNNHQQLHCQDLTKVPYNFTVFELYGLSHNEALKVYAKYNTIQKPISIKEKLQYFKSHNLSCHTRGWSTRWPFMVYYGCSKK